MYNNCLGFGINKLCTPYIHASLSNMILQCYTLTTVYIHRACEVLSILKG